MFLRKIIVIITYLSDFLNKFHNSCAPVLEWTFHNPPKPHAFSNILCSASPLLLLYQRRLGEAARIPSGEKMFDEAEGDKIEFAKIGNWHISNINTHADRVVQQANTELRQQNIQPATRRELNLIKDNAVRTADRAKSAVGEGLRVISQGWIHNFLPFVVLEFYWVESIFLTLAIFFENSFAYCIALVQPLLQIYRIYTIPRRIRAIYNFIVVAYNHSKNCDFSGYCAVVVYVVLLCFLFTIGIEFIL